MAGPCFHAKPDDASILDFKGAPQTGGILQYFEDLKQGTNKEFGPKDFFEMASNPFLEHYYVKRYKP